MVSRLIVLGLLSLGLILRPGAQAWVADAWPAQAGPTPLAAVGAEPPADQAPSLDAARVCAEALRATDDGLRVERFLRDAQRDLGPAGALLGDESRLLERLGASADPETRAANHALLHAVLGGRLDDATHEAMHALMGEMLACLDGA